MVQQAKIDAVQNLAEKINKVKSLLLVDFSKLSVPLQNKLRQAALNAGGQFRVVKNNLLKLALQKSKPDWAKEKPVSELTGQTATLFALKDELEPIKVLVKFIEENELPQLKFGFFEDKLIDKKAIEELAKIPGRQELYAQTVILINSPLAGLVFSLNWNLNQLVWTLENMRKGGE